MKFFQSAISAFKIKKLKNQILFTIMIAVLIRIGSQFPIPGIDTSYFRNWIEQNTGGMFNIISAFSGGSFERFSIFALGITPYITASIITQLLTVVFPKLEEIQKDGEYGRKKMERINRYVAAGLALLESTAMAIGFGKSGLIPNMSIIRGIVVVVCMLGGTCLIMLAAWGIDKKGIGNGTSIILTVNILSGMPASLYNIYENLIKGNKIPVAILIALISAAVIIAVTALVIVLNEAIRKIPVHYSRKIQGGSGMIGQKSYIPLKVNISSVIPVIFASSLLSIPQMIAGITGYESSNKVLSFVLNCINQNQWFKKVHPEYTLGLVLYLFLVFFFAYFYASITFNPMEIADNIKKQGGSIPGIRQGKPTEEYIKNIVNRLVFIGAVGLMIVVLIPMSLTSIFNISVSFGGTSLIIIAGVILETLTEIESQMHVRRYKGLLS